MRDRSDTCQLGDAGEDACEEALVGFGAAGLGSDGLVGIGLVIGAGRFGPFIVQGAASG